MISVVIPTYNRKKLLRKCLESLFNQTYPKNKYEVMIVDDGSSDSTESLIKTLQKKNSNLHFLKHSHVSVAKVRNLGIENARGEIIAFTDDDCLPQKDWLGEIDETFQKHPGILGIEGKTLTYPNLVTPFTSQIVNTKGGGYQTCNIAYKRKILKKLKGLDEKFGFAHCDDVDLALRVLGEGQILFAPRVIVIHPPRPTSFLAELDRIKRITAELYLFLKHPDYFYQKYGKGNIFWQVVFINSIWIRLFHLKFYSHWIKKNPWLYLKFLFRTMLEIALIILSIPQLYLSYTKLKQFVSSPSAKQQKLNR